MFTPGAFSRTAFSASGFYVGSGTIEMTLTDIIARFRAVLEASPLSLVATTDAFSHDKQPTTLVSGTYYIEDGGLVNSRPLGNYTAARIDRLVIYVAGQLNAAPQAAKEAMETTLLTAERQLKADGPPHGYHVDLGGARRVTHPKGADFLVGSLALSVDYDVDESAS